MHGICVWGNARDMPNNNALTQATLCIKENFLLSSVLSCYRFLSRYSIEVSCNNKRANINRFLLRVHTALHFTSFVFFNYDGSFPINNNTYAKIYLLWSFRILYLKLMLYWINLSNFNRRTAKFTFENITFFF